MVQFVAAGLLVLAVLLALTLWLSGRAALQEAIARAQSTTSLLASAVVAPELPPTLVAGDPEAQRAFDRVVRRRVLGEVDGLVRVKLWSADGRIVYSDEPRLVGEWFGLDDHDLEVLRSGGAAAEVSDLSNPENAYERPFGRLYEVYASVRAPDGEPLLFEAYYRSSDLTADGRHLREGFTPIILGGLLLLQVVTLPLVWRLARRLSDPRDARERLLVRAVESSDRERRRIARDLHDGVVQDLAGVSFALSALATQAAGGRDATRPVVDGLEKVAGGVRQSIRSLRALLVEIYPPYLAAEGLAAALSDLLAPLAGAGVQTELSVPPGMDLSRSEASLVFRVAQEAVRNAARHASPTRVDVMLQVDAEDVRLTVRDDGRGFDVAAVQREDGPVGLRILRYLVEETGGRLHVESEVGTGTTVRLEVPVGR